MSRAGDAEEVHIVIDRHLFGALNSCTPFSNLSYRRWARGTWFVLVVIHSAPLNTRPMEPVTTTQVAESNPDPSVRRSWSWRAGAVLAVLFLLIVLSICYLTNPCQPQLTFSFTQMKIGLGPHRVCIATNASNQLVEFWAESIELKTPGGWIDQPIPSVGSPGLPNRPAVHYVVHPRSSFVVPFSETLGMPNFILLAPNDVTWRVKFRYQQSLNVTKFKGLFPRSWLRRFSSSKWGTTYQFRLPGSKTAVSEQMTPGKQTATAPFTGTPASHP
jgi:hypothetical protein